MCMGMSQQMRKREICHDGLKRERASVSTPNAARTVMDLIGSDMLPTKPKCSMCVWSRGCFLRALPPDCKRKYMTFWRLSVCLSSVTRKVFLLCRKLYTNLVHVIEHYLISFYTFLLSCFNLISHSFSLFVVFLSIFVFSYFLFLSFYTLSISFC
jgi:hypothetical protein